MALRTAAVKDTVSYRSASGKTYNALVTGTQPSTPSISSTTTQTTGGSIPNSTATSYRLSVIINGAESQASVAGTVTTGGSGNAHKVTISWSAVTGASAYRIYGRTSGSELFIAETTATSYEDLGSITPAGVLPSAGEVGMSSGTGLGAPHSRSAKKATTTKSTDAYFLF